MKSFFTPKEVIAVLRAEGLNIKYSQLVSWDKRQFIEPSYRRRGKYRLYTYADLLRVKMAAVLRSEYSMPKVRQVMREIKEHYFPKMDFPLGDAKIYIRRADSKRKLPEVFVGDGKLILPPNTPGTTPSRYRILRAEDTRNVVNKLYSEQDLGLGASDTTGKQESRAHHLPYETIDDRIGGYHLNHPNKEYTDY